MVLNKPLGDMGDFVRAKRPRRLPVVLTPQEVESVLNGLTGVHQLMAGLLYGSGLRLMECLRLRVQDVDFSQIPVLSTTHVLPFLRALFRERLRSHFQQQQYEYHRQQQAGPGNGPGRLAV